MKRAIVLLALVWASAVPAPAMAWDGSWNAPLIIGGLLGAAYGQQRVIPQQPRVMQQQPAQVIVIERQPQVIVVRDETPRTTTVVHVVDQKIVGTGCISRTYGWTGQWIALPNGTKACKAS